MARRRSERGMTLLEVLIALGISSVGLLGALAMLGALMQGGAFSRSATEASILAQSRLEELVSLPLASLPANGTVVTEAGLDPLGRLNTGGTFSRVTTWGPSPDGMRRTITVSVAWNDGLGRPHAVTAARDRAP